MPWCSNFEAGLYQYEHRQTPPFAVLPAWDLQIISPYYGATRRPFCKPDRSLILTHLFLNPYLSGYDPLFYNRKGGEVFRKSRIIVSEFIKSGGGVDEKRI